jgi:hypothetical protein
MSNSALTVQMNQVHSELQHARGLIDEKDSELQRIRLSNNQVCCLAIKGLP